MKMLPSDGMMATSYKKYFLDQLFTRHWSFLFFIFLCVLEYKVDTFYKYERTFQLKNPIIV